jgi:RND family efflux transporter MFP subunit
MHMNIASKQVGHWSSPAALIAVAVAVSQVAALSGCRGGEVELAPEVRPVRSMTVDTHGSTGTVALTGSIRAQTEVNESFRIDGRLIERTVDIGDSVSPGQLVARLDPQNEEMGLQAARAQLAAAVAQQVEAQSNFARMKDLVAEDAVSRSSYEQADARQRVAASQVEAAQAQVNLSQNRLGYTRLVASAAGVVTARGPEPGEMVGPGRMVIQVAVAGARDAVFDVPTQVKDVAPQNPRITVALTSDPTVTAVGQVREVSPRADPVTGTFAVRVRLVDPPAKMRLGTTVTGRMRLDSAPAIAVPASALHRAEGQSAVWIVDPKASTVSLRSIEVRASDTSVVQVGSGLNPGDIVVTAGVQALRAGQKVRLLENKQ